MAADPYLIDIDDLWPRDADHRFRLYARRGDKLDVLAAAPDVAGLGAAIQQMHEDCREGGSRFMDLGATGILDAVAGEWIILPWHRPDGRPTLGRLPVAIHA